MNAREESWSSQIARLLALLSGLQREVLRLRIVAELSVEETATVLGSTPAAVSTIERHALRGLREALITRRLVAVPAPRSSDRCGFDADLDG